MVGNEESRKKKVWLVVRIHQKIMKKQKRVLNTSASSRHLVYVFASSVNMDQCCFLSTPGRKKIISAHQYLVRRVNVLFFALTSFSAPQSLYDKTAIYKGIGGWIQICEHGRSWRNCIIRGFGAFSPMSLFKNI